MIYFWIVFNLLLMKKKGKSFLFIYNDNILDKNKSLEELNIKNGDEVKVGELK